MRRTSNGTRCEPGRPCGANTVSPATIGVGYIGLRLFCKVFTDRGDERRVISLRKANAREVANYAKR